VSTNGVDAAVACKKQTSMPKEAFVYQEAHFRVLRLLEGNPQMNQRDLAAAAGVSLGKTNYCLNALLDKGLIKVQNFKSSKRKLAYAYLLTPAGIAEKAALTERFLERKMEEYDALRAEIEQLKQEAADN
jgi:EPS-associated MarR family transcriptional regulator